jgi:hypothetical protein
MLDRSISLTSDRDLIAALAIAISQHPFILNTPVYAPDRPTERIKIEKIKLYGGRELTEAGLVLGVYPDMRGLGNGVQGYLSEQPLSIASNQNNDAAFLLEAHFVAQLSYRITDFDTPVILKYGVDEDLQLINSTELYGYSSSKFNYYTPKSLEVVVLPAEEVLKDWTTLLRYAIRDIRYLRPYHIRSPQIKGVAYRTSEIFDKSAQENLVFHTSSIHFSIMYTEGRLRSA